MRVLWRLFLWLWLALPLAAAAQVEVPAFTPNVVDGTGHLSAQDVAEINAAFDEMRAGAGVLPALYVVDMLRGEDIEHLAERAFRQWRLGEKGKDNGLLLVVALQDRRSRFEVGYGLEGDLTDLQAGQALNDAFNPLMREGRTKDAVLAAFHRLLATKWPALESDHTTRNAITAPQDEVASFINVRGGLWVWAGWGVLLLGMRPLARSVQHLLARRLQRMTPDYTMAADASLAEKRSDTFVLGLSAGMFVRLFLLLNPGIFLFLFAGNYPRVVLPACALVLVAFVASKAARYRSPAAFRAWREAPRLRESKRQDRDIRRHRERFDAWLAKGYIRKTATGQYEYTSTWFQSEEYREAKRRVAADASDSGSGSGSASSWGSSGSSDSSSGSSSSGGGSSGGGGASSSW